MQRRSAPPPLFSLHREYYSGILPLMKWISGASLHGSNPEPFMSALGSKVDIGLPPIDGRFTPKSGHC
jgi:hypothetical protein